MLKRSAQRYCLPDPSAALTDEVICRHIEPGSRVVDLGCGDGRLSQMLRDRLGCEVLGVELDELRLRGRSPAECP